MSLETNTLKVEQDYVFPPEETIPVDFSDDFEAYSTRSCVTSVVQCLTDMCVTAGCTTYCGPSGTYKICAC